MLYLTVSSFGCESQSAFNFCLCRECLLAHKIFIKVSDLEISMDCSHSSDISTILHGYLHIYPPLSWVIVTGLQPVGQGKLFFLFTQKSFVLSRKLNPVLGSENKNVDQMKQVQHRDHQDSQRLEHLPFDRLRQ